MGKIKRIADIVELQLSSAGRMATDPLGSGGFIQDPNRLEKFDADMRTLKSVISSANDKIHLIGESVKSFNDSLTELGKSFIVTKDTAQHAVGAVNSVSTADLNGGDLLSGTSAGGLYETTMNIRGAEAKEILRQKVFEIGGKVAFSHDKATIQFPILDSTYQQYLQEQQAYVKGVSNPLARYSPETRVKHELFDEAMRESGREGRRIRRLERERENAILANYNARRLDPETYAGASLREKLGGDAVLTGLSDKEINQRIKAYDKDVIKKKEEEKERKRIKAKQKKEEKEKQEGLRSARNAIFAVISIITVIANIGRRLLTAVLDLGRERREAGLEARALGLPASALIEAGYTEQARGLKSGTIAGALSVLQQKFGDPRALDESALRELAPYIPQAIAPAVRSGLYGGANSQQLLELIVNNAVDRIGKGLNWAGEQVGEKEARRNIIASLERVSPDLAKIANSMYDTNRFGIYAGQAGTYGQWSRIGFGKQNPLTLANSENISQMYGMIGTRFEAGWDSFKTSVLDKLSGILSWLENTDIGLSDEEKATKKVKDYALALQTEQELQAEGRTRLSLFANTLKSSYGIDFSSGKYKFGDKTLKSVGELMDLNPNALISVISQYPELSEAFQNLDVISQLTNIQVLASLVSTLTKDLNKVREGGNLSGFKFDKIKYSAEHRALMAGDTTGALLHGVFKIPNFNPYTIPSVLTGQYTPSGVAPGSTFNEAVDYMQSLGNEYGVDFDYAGLNPAIGLDFLKQTYEWAMEVGDKDTISKVKNALRTLYGSTDKNLNWGKVFRELYKKAENKELLPDRIGAVISTSGIRGYQSVGVYSEGTNNLMPENVVEMASKAVAQRNREQLQQSSLLWSTALQDPTVASYLTGLKKGNGTLNKGTVTALDEYTLDVNLNVTSDGKTETKTFRIKSNSSGTKAGATATFDIANAKAQGSSY